MEPPFVVDTTTFQTQVDDFGLANEKVDDDADDDTEGEVFVVSSEENLLDTAIY